MRIGHGYDVHRFSDERKLVLGGVEIPYEKGLLGHSDADVLLHAICDALLGAAALGDIGRLFPDDDDEYLNISSLILLKKVVELLEKNGHKVINIDATVICQEPKISPYTDDMCAIISATTDIDIENINIKATTEEKMGFTGRKEGIAAHAVCLID